jgi:hypothetical protein
MNQSVRKLSRLPVVLLLITGALVAGFVWQHWREDKLFRDALNRKADLQDFGKRHIDWRAEAKAQASLECSNVVTGLSRIVRMDISDSDGDANKWTGVAVAEYVNKFGGLERTNVHLRFSYARLEDGSHDLRCAAFGE